MAHVINDLLNKGYRLFVDNWYTFVELFSHLHDCIGKLHKDHKGIPNDVVSKTLKAVEQIVNYVQNTVIMHTK